MACHLYWQLGGSLRDLAEVVELGRRGLLRIDVEHFSFAEIELAFERLEAGTVAGRVVVTPDG